MWKPVLAMLLAITVSACETTYSQGRKMSEQELCYETRMYSDLKNAGYTDYNPYYEGEFGYWVQLSGHLNMIRSGVQSNPHLNWEYCKSQFPEVVASFPTFYKKAIKAYQSEPHKVPGLYHVWYKQLNNPSGGNLVPQRSNGPSSDALINLGLTLMSGGNPSSQNQGFDDLGGSSGPSLSLPRNELCPNSYLGRRLKSQSFNGTYRNCSYY